MNTEKRSQITTKTFTPPHPLKTAVLFMIFNRPDTTKQVSEAIRTAKPPRLYVAADGPRADKAGEQEKCEQVRRIATQVDWDCEVKTLFRDKNLGCRMGVSSAINWFFENEEEGIILEDDCLPSQSFFWFCEELLEKYKNDMRVGQINGTNVLGNFNIENYSYHFSNFGSIWGWATWKEAWKHYDLYMKSWPFIKDKKFLKSAILNQSEYNMRSYSFEKTYKKKIDTWDYQWIYARLVNRMLIVIPKNNLISNIGFGNDATHTRDPNNELNAKNNMDITFPLTHPTYFLPNLEFENKVHSKKFLPIYKIIYNKIKNTIRSIWEKK